MKMVYQQRRNLIQPAYGSFQQGGFGTSYEVLVKQKDYYRAQQVISKR